MLVKRLAMILFAVAACKSASTRGDTQLTGAPSARGAVESFLSAVRAQDLQAMSTVWGNAKGPARDVVDRDQLEKRELIMQCYLGHDSFNVLSDTRTKGDEHVLQVSLTKGNITRETSFTTVQGPSERWYVLSADLEPVKDLCAKSPGS
jgi:hypothetical protein